MQTATKQFPGGYTTATMIPTHSGMFKVTVIHRFDSGNFCTEKPHDNLSKVAALGLLHFYTS